MLIACTITKEYCLAENAKKNQIYLCPGCFGPVRLKKGEEKVAHFAHVVKDGCARFSEGESPEHLAGKLALFKYFEDRVPVLVEPVLSKIDQRPDLLVGRPGNQVAIEYQCSPISKKDLDRRNEGYARLGIKVWWILGPNYYKKHLSAGTVCRFILAGKLWYFLPEQKIFMVESNFVRPDFKKRRSEKRHLADPLYLRLGGTAAWSRVFSEKNDRWSARVLDIDRQRTKLSFMMAREQINPDLVNYLYENGHRVDQIPDCTLNGFAFGLTVPNWQYRLTVLLLLELDGVHWHKKNLQARMARYFHEGAPGINAILEEYLSELEQGEYIRFKEDEIVLLRSPKYLGDGDSVLE
ncbi:hypothetical protein G6R29_04495 [Fructobacillus sp. M2-14]|uniref:Competence protein n=1 Tax=Fructobacillus broussonetiae TaxID=2713173 RepID=A0ABS5R0A4_9LACO|nr:competence protein CoiA family protein [Fructobacillus broussonetiae]MBS9338883.1 hypothetical protein [Fructobacillus broussonetiae]